MKNLTVIISLITMLALAGCGRKSALEAPEGAPPPDPDRPVILDPLVK